MRRAIILVVLLFASLSFLLLQIISIKGLDEQRSWTAKLGKAVRFGLENKKESPAWKNLNTISQILDEFNLRAFLLEPDILQDLVIEEISGNTSSIWYFAPRFLKSNCRYVCGKPRILLGVFDDQWTDMRDNFEVVLIKEGFNSKCCKNQDPRLITVDKTIHHSIDFHCSFTKDGNTIDFVVFYKRQEFLWHGSVSEINNKIEKPGLAFGKTAAAYSRFELKKKSIDGIKMLIPKQPNTFLFEMKTSRFLECNVKQAQTFYSNYGEELSEEAEQFTTVARNILEIAKRALDALGIRFWLSSGTCLGWFRQCGVIPYSKDVDIGIWIKDYDSRLIERFERYGLTLKHKFGKVSCVCFFIILSARELCNKATKIHHCGPDLSMYLLLFRTRSFVHSFIHFPTHPFGDSFIYSLIRWFGILEC
ncbi:fukutin isoform X2 [Exaiptasia diaphana]|uniref:Fukutin n=1 Tax=Exaiptasia diaphana TaxID=2652724 RepID=A0A913WYY6_EXADI|nr:fukutin isoform X2 [Exaiptasia diaphana]